MASRFKLKESFEVESQHAAFFTGNQIAWTSDGTSFLCQDGAKVNMLELESGKVTTTFCTSSSEDEDIKDDPVTAFALSEDEFGSYLFVSYRSGLIAKWSRTENEILRSWKSVHKGPVARIAVDEDAIYLATGGSDSKVRIWELANFNCIHSLKGCQGVTSVLKFRPNSNEIFAAGDDCKIRSWSVSNGAEILVLESHFSQVTAIEFYENQLVSTGRDSVICLWNLDGGALLKTIPTYESMEGMVLLPASCVLPGNYHVGSNSGPHVAVAGEKGVVRVWQVEKAKEIFVQSNSQISPSTEPGGLAVTTLMLHDNVLAMVGVDHTIALHTLSDFECQRLLIGYCDEILDIVYCGKGDTCLAVASNSPDIKLYRLKDMHCLLLKGHTDLVLALSASPSQPNLLASSAKDNTVKLWLIDEEVGKVACVASGERHTGSIGAVVFSQTSAEWLYSGAQDNCIKAWKIKENEKEYSLTPVHSAIAHDKEINGLCVSPNDKFVASASQDKTAKLWNADLTLIGALRGHKRGVWCARFSSADQVIATGSADCTIRLWNLADLTCIKTFEGHDASVLKLEFLASGLQIISSAGDGLLKLWTIKNSECTLTLDGHDGRIWALAVQADQTRMVSGGSDSKLVVWRDTTVEKQEKTRQEMVEKVEQDQTLSNLMHNQMYESALELSLQLNRPKTTLKIIQILSQEKDKLRGAVKKLNPELQESLLQLALKWNSNTRNYTEAQLILEFMLTEGSVQLSASDLAQALAFTNKHFQRLSQLRADLHFLTYTASRMALLPDEM
ncbi:transducin beta-like protein 3 [Neocloeon triangulifer]|uniref:transducin beta-like protein 3 n=1 Tax=Neocloeon triangulifer TaxID=2078957 RepID=UPI00286ECB6A|nr:transducin beta-like protein 3 [Neocloeon triangulifer]